MKQRRTVTELRYEMAMMLSCESTVRQNTAGRAVPLDGTATSDRVPLSSLQWTWPDACAGRDRCLATAGQRGGAHADVARPMRAQPRGYVRVSVAGRDAVLSGADLSQPASGAAQPSRDRISDRAGATGRNPRSD